MVVNTKFGMVAIQVGINIQKLHQGAIVNFNEQFHAECGLMKIR